MEHTDPNKKKNYKNCLHADLYVAETRLRIQMADFMIFGVVLPQETS